jgi:hypothetical protein
MKLALKILTTSLLFSFLSIQNTFAQVVERSVTIENPDTTGKISVAQLTDEANQKMAEDLIIEYVGAEAFARNKVAFNSKVIQNVLKFVPYQKALDPERGPFGVRLTVEYKISLTEFRKLLADAGTFSKTRLAQFIVSFITIEDESGNRLAVSWKKNNNREAGEWMREWNDDFKKVFEKAGYAYNKNLNPAWLETFDESSSAQDVLNHNTVPNSYLLWGIGKIVINKVSQERTLVVQTRFYSQEYKREVTDSARRFSLKDDGHPKFEIWAQDLVSQLDEIDVKSLKQDALLKVIVVGAIGLTEQDQFKQLITNSSSLIKSVSERRFESNQIVYEIETDAKPEVLAEKFKMLDWKGKKMKIEVSSNEIRLELAP